MFEYKKIEGIDVLRDRIPPELQAWCCFSNIIELNYSSKAADEFYCDYTNMVTLLLSDDKCQYKIKLTLYNIRGNLNFDMLNGLYSGFTIEECLNSERENNFHIYSDEQDIEYNLYCEKIRAVLV